ncbi:PAS domain S-box protein [Pelagibius sp. Alg239-R121]|uniref:PAS domain-containing sensor histidine kinase n=1 Tax=Pelagibius sp. Alg239-R121 TaxID=2993448 RepID=UPI0024A67A50|nr:PAS domain S-box protein [Pelagibius sp. Alg239-R121]
MKANRGSWKELLHLFAGTRPDSPSSSQVESRDDLQSKIDELEATNSRLLAEIQAQIETHAALEESKAQLSDLAAAASDWVWMLDEQLRFSYVSENYDLRSNGITSEILGKTRWEFAKADPENDAHWTQHRTCLEARKPFRDFRYSFINKKGTREYYRTSGVPYFDASGEFRGYRGTANSETKKVLTRQKAAQLEQSYREIYENAVVGIFRATPEGEFVQANPALVKLFNFENEKEFLSAVNRAPEDLFPEPVLRVAIKQEIEKNGMIKDFETELRDKTHNERVWVGITGGEVRDEKGVLNYYEGMIEDITKRKTAEATLMRRERELAQAQRIGRSGHWRWFVDEGIIERSDEMCRLLGIATDSTRSTKQEGDSFIHPEDRPAFQERQRRAIEKGIPYKSEHRVVMPDGEIKYHSCEGHPEHNGNGRIVSIFGINRDVTEQREAEEALRDSERQLNEAQRLGHMGHWRFDNNRESTRWSDELWRIFGLKPEDRELGLDEIFSKVHKEDRERIRKESKEAWAALRHFTQDYRIVLPDGNIRYVRVEAHPQTDDNGNLLSYFGVTQDVTQKTEADAALKEGEERNRAVVEALDRANVGLSITTDERGITDVNSAILKFAGVSNKEQIIGRKLAELQQHGRSDYAAIGEEMYESIARNGSWVGELDWRRPDGGIVNLNVRSAPFIDDAIIHIVSDITDQRKREQREAELEEGMKQSQKMEALGQMAGGIAHEINNLLHPIINFTKLTRDQVEDSQLKHYLSRTLECGRKAAEIVNDVLTFAHKGSGQRKVVDLVELTKRTIRFAQDITPPDIVLSIKTIDGTASVKVNETEFIQVVLNLVQNANDAMAGVGEIQLELDRIHLAQLESGKLGLAKGDYARITVIDRGHGISDDLVEHVFEPFFTTKEVGRGTGLGLAVVYGIVKGWDGAISIKSKKDVGSSFEVYVPMITNTESAPESEGA